MSDFKIFLNYFSQILLWNRFVQYIFHTRRIAVIYLWLFIETWDCNNCHVSFCRFVLLTLQNLFCSFVAVHIWHCDIHQHQFDDLVAASLVSVLVELVDWLLTTGCLFRFNLEILKHNFKWDQIERMVIHKQHSRTYTLLASCYHYKLNY